MRRLHLLVAFALATACGSSPPSPAPLPAPRAVREVFPVVGPARYVAPDSTWVERTSDGVDRVIVNGRRLEVKGITIASMGPKDPEVDGGAVAPAWTVAPGATPPARYVFWKGKDLYGATTFTGELHKLGSVPTGVRGAFDWVNGVGLQINGGAIVVGPNDAAPHRLGVSLVAQAVAADASRALVVNALGRSLLTLDGGKTFKDVSAEVGEITSIEVRGDDIAAVGAQGREKTIDAKGAIVDARAHGRRRGRPAELDPDLWPGGSPLLAAVESGVPLDDGGAVVTSRGFVGRMDLATGKTTSLAVLGDALADADCKAVRARDAILLACVGQKRASVIDVSGTPIVERTFDLASDVALDHFVADDGEALGYLGPCDGSERQKPAVDAISTASQPANTSTERSDVFCVRASRDRWVEHRLDPGDAADVYAWAPRAGGGAVAIVSRTGAFLGDEPRVVTRGSLRIVRVARTEPPLQIPNYYHASPLQLSRAIHVRADDVIEAWLPTMGGTSNFISVEIGADGIVHANDGPPRPLNMMVAGRFGFGSDRMESRFFETIDRGKHWYEVEAPPGDAAYSNGCSPVGCRVGSFVRIGWATPDHAAVEPSLAERRDARDARQKQQSKSYLPPAPLFKLACTFDGPAEGARIPDSHGFGVTPSAIAQTGYPGRLGSLGMAQLPYPNGYMGYGSSSVAPTGDVDLGWVSPFDPLAVVHRAVVSGARSGLSMNARYFDPQLGFILLPDGSLDPVAQSSNPDNCIATLFEAAGLTRPVGGCVKASPGPSGGWIPSLGVDLGGHAVLVNIANDGITVSASDAPPLRKDAGAAAQRLAQVKAALKPKPKPKPAASASASASASTSPSSAPTIALAPLSPFNPKLPGVRELHETRVAGGARAFGIAVGSRDGLPVMIAIDALADAALAPIDPDRGLLGASEPMRPLRDVALASDPICAAPKPGEARVLLAFDSMFAIDRELLRGVAAVSQSQNSGLLPGGLALLRWSKDRVCLEAIEISVRDERYEGDQGYYDQQGTVRKVIARFDKGSGGKGGGKGGGGGGGDAALVLVGPGAELRQRLACKSIEREERPIQ